MRRVLALLLLLLVAIAAPAFAADVTLTPGESRRMEIFGVTAAWTIDASVADVSVVQGSITLFGRAAGRTKLIVSGVTGEHTYDVSVTQRAGTQTGASHARADRATAELRYASAAGEVQSAVHVTHEDAKRRTEATLRTIHQTETPAGERARTSVAEASYRIFTPGRELTFFDRDVDHSPLTLAATPLRGIHYLDEHWRLHAGYTAYATYRSFLVPIERQFVAGGGYAFRASARSTVTPSFFAIRGEGTVGSVLYDYARDERLAVRGEIGYSHGLGAAGAVDYDGERDRVYASLRYRPHDFAVAGNATPRGFFGDASWTHEYGRGSTGTASWSATDTAGVRVMSAAADVDHRLNDDLALLGGASWASFDGRRTWTIPAGVRAELGRVGVTALYRQSSGGPGGRLALRTSLGRFYASAYADHQRNVPTLAVLFAERPDLALALEELGINASSPADVARALREHAVLAELGFIDGVTLELAPSRTQFGFEAAYLGTTAARQQLRLRLLRNVIETVSARTTSTIATISYARRLTDAADVFASWTYWRTDTAAAGSRTQPFAEIGVRRSFDTLPSLFGGSGTIAGAVFADEDLDGRSDGRGVAAEVELDGAKVQRTREDGSFAFTGVPGGVHRVTARVPDRPEAYFTTPSRVEAEPGQRVEFGVSATPARLLGRVIDDAGRGIAGVRVLLARGAKQLVATTSSDGGFSFAASPGEWQMSLLTDSVPAGYSVTGSEARAVMLDLAAPAQVRVALDAHRGIRGQAAPAAEIDVQPLRIRVRADAQGRYALRSLPPGALTLTSGGIVRRVELPAEPATLTVDFAAAVASAPPATAPVVRLSGQFVVQLGAFRNSANAAAIAARARAAGVEVTLQAGRSLTFVRTTPLPTRASVEALVARLARAGLEAVVLFEN